MIPPKIRLKTKEWSLVCTQASKDFAQEGANLGRAQGTSYQKPKTPRICTAIFYEVCNFIVVFAIILFYFSIPVRGGGGAFLPFGCVPATWRINSGKIHYGMMLRVNMARNTPY